MAGKQSGFITGANARIKLDGASIAYCTDVSYNIAIQTIPIETMGTYEVRDNVAVSYTVDGAFSIIRYTKHAGTVLKDGGTAAIPNGNLGGNAPGTTAKSDGQTLATQLNPATLLQSSTFDLQISEATAKPDGVEAGEVQNVFLIRDCRLTRRGMTLNKRGVYVDQYAFVGILAGDNEADIAPEFITEQTPGDDDQDGA